MKLFSPRIAAFDLDGTVLCKGKMSPAVRKALLTLKAHGITTVIASGRDMAQISPEVSECFSYTVAANGAYITDNKSGALLSEHPMEKPLINVVIKAVLHHGGGPVLFQNGAMVGNLRAPLRMPGGSPKTYKSVKAAYCATAQFLPLLGIYAVCSKKPVYKIQGFFRTAASCSAAAEEIKKCPELEVLDMGDCTLEITMRGVTKAAALSLLCETLGLSMEKMAAFGDSRNDLAMLHAAGLAVAMGNGADCVKEAADYIAPDVSEDGAAKAIYDIFGI